MATFSTQFHATLDELVDFVERWATTHSLYITAVHHPFRAEPMSVGHVEEVLSAPTVYEVVLTVKPPDLSDPTGLRFFDKNEERLLLQIGRLRERGLEESWLTTKQSNPTWAKINTDLKRHTTAGAIATNEETGHSGPSRNRRFTAGARALSERGIPLRQYAQLPTVFRPL